MKNNWILKNGSSTQDFDSFPFAFRTMFAIAKKASETGKFSEVTLGLSIISPQMDAHGDYRRYSYEAATVMATSSGLLTAEGQINSKEFKRKY